MNPALPRSIEAKAMQLIVRLILVLTLTLQPVLLQAQAMASCDHRPAPASAPEQHMACCGMPGAECCCNQSKAGGCDCETAPTDIPASPDRTTNPVPDSSAMVLVPVAILAWNTHSEIPSPGSVAHAGTAARISVESIQSLQCVWLI